MSGVPLKWRELHLPRPLDIDRAVSLLRRISTDSNTRGVVFEARGAGGSVRYFVGASPRRLDHVERLIQRELPKTLLSPAETRAAVMTAAHLKANTRHRQLRVDDPLPPVRTVLGALAAATDAEATVLQVVLGAGRVPLAIPNHTSSAAAAPWWHALWYGDRGQLDGEQRAALRTKVADHGFACVVRIGATAATTDRQRALIAGVLAALRTSEAPGVRLRLRTGSTARLNAGTTPLLLWSLRMGIRELLVMLAWGIGDSELPGHAAIHPRRLPPPAAIVERGRVVARSNAPGHEHSLLRSSAHDARQHVHVIGPTGVGKSVLLGRLIAQDIAAGHGVFVVEPKGDLVDDVLKNLPSERLDDVVVLDPLDSAPVGLNPLRSSGSRDAAVEGLLSVFRALYGDALGPRSGDVLHASLLTLMRHRSASLVMLPLLLTNDGFRRSLTSGINDPIGLSPFWSWYEALSEGERRTVIAPLMNKLRPWLLNPRLRAAIGQREPRFTMQDIFTQRRILLMPLRGASIGEEAARLLGSLAVAQLWQATRARAAVPAERRRTVMVYIDEVQDYLHLPTDLADAFAQARGLGVSFTVAHQFMGQLSPAMQAGVLANARSRIAFQLSHADAVTVAKGHPELTPDDLTALDAYHVYASLHAAGKAQPFASGVTLPPGPAISNPATVRERSRAQYGRPLDEIEASFLELTHPAELSAPTGRRRRQP